MCLRKKYLLKEVRCLYLALFLFFIPINLVHAAFIDVGISDSQVEVNDVFQVSFDISGLTFAASDSLSGFDIDIRYDDSVVGLTGFDFASPLQGNQFDFFEPSALLFFGEVNEIGSGVIDSFAVSGNSFSVLDAEQENAFTFLLLEFTALAEISLTSIEIDLDDLDLLFLDSDFGDLPISFSSSFAELSIGSMAIPEPTTLALLALGLLGLWRRKIYFLSQFFQESYYAR